MVDYFPLSTATGAAFCNRVHEVYHLQNNIKMTRPTLVMSPRRYGKTSLVIHALKKSNVLYSHIDFYKLVNMQEVEKCILDGIGHLLAQLEGKPKKLLKLAADFFSDLQVKVVLGSKLELSVEFGASKNTAATLLKALNKLHKLVEEKKTAVVFYIDEFQKLEDIVADHSIEAVLREAAQHSTHITYIFSGSNRHLVQDMFFDSKRPFYKLCDTIYLNRIETDPYIKYIQKAAKIRWKIVLSERVIMDILDVTQNHPYYVNLVCSKLWLGDPPSSACVKATWDTYAHETRSQIEREIDMLSTNQRKLLISLARFGPTAQPTGQDFIAQVGMSTTSLALALKSLIEKDYVYQDDGHVYRILDPLFAYVLA